jgi:restriction system protein
MKVDDAKLGLDELGAHLKRKFSDVYSISPRRFEELVANIYRHLGYDVRLTKSTRDGGFDVILLDAGSDEQIIVECKKYSLHRKVGIGVVRELLGAQVLGGFSEAKLVTSSHFTFVAEEVPSKLLEMSTSFHLELVDADQLLRNLEVYNKELPPLYLLEECSYFED